jgi:hypothetical protein
MSLALSVVDMPTLLLLLLLHCSKCKYYGLPVMVQISNIKQPSKTTKIKQQQQQQKIDLMGTKPPMIEYCQR